MLFPANLLASIEEAVSAVSTGKMAVGGQCYAVKYSTDKLTHVSLNPAAFLPLFDSKQMRATCTLLQTALHPPPPAC